LEYLVTVHDVGDLLVTLATERGSDEGQRRAALRRSEISEAQSIAAKNGAWKVRPSGSLRAVEREGPLHALRVGERRKERIGSGDDASRRGSGWCGRRLYVGSGFSRT